jgi:hypothetical protein
MPRPTIDYLNARRALKPASGGTNYRVRERAIYDPEIEDEQRRRYAEEERWLYLLKSQRSKQVELLKEFLIRVGTAVGRIRQIDEMIARSESEMTTVIAPHDAEHAVHQCLGDDD